jgi:hypothetical protein
MKPQSTAVVPVRANVVMGLIVLSTRIARAWYVPAASVLHPPVAIRKRTETKQGPIAAVSIVAIVLPVKAV